MAILRERLEEARKIIEKSETDGFNAIKPEYFYAEFERANKIYAERVLSSLQNKGCFTEAAARGLLADKNQFLADIDKRFEEDSELRRRNSLVGNNYNRTYNLLKTFMDKFSLEDQADEQEKERAARYDIKEKQSAMFYRLVTTFLVGIVFVALAYLADFFGLQFIFLHKKPVCPENYVCIRQEEHDKQRKELEELTKRAAAYVIPGSKLINPVPGELKPQSNLISNTRKTQKEKE